MSTAVRTVQIVKTPGVRGGKARIEGTSNCVQDVVYLHKTGLGPAQIQIEHPNLNPAQIYAALSYFYLNPDEIETEIERDREWEETFEVRKAEDLAKRACR